ncbi:MAG: hypothetical protein QXR19_14910 [Candidatus Jordarchaeaceae archaeon]
MARRIVKPVRPPILKRLFNVSRARLGLGVRSPLPGCVAGFS